MTARAIALLDRDDGADLARWTLAAAVVLAIHLGLMATYLLLFQQQHSHGVSAPLIVDMVPMPAAPASPLDLAPGPEMIDADRPVTPQVVEPRPPDPVLEPTPPVPEPLVALPEPAKQPPRPEVQEKPEPKKVTKRVERKPPAPRTAAAPRSERAAQASAPASLGNPAASAAVASWREMVVAQLQRAKRYPKGAESRREQGVVTLNFTLSRSGAVLSRSIARGSGHPELDQE